VTSTAILSWLGLLAINIHTNSKTLCTIDQLQMAFPLPVPLLAV
jgi:hypothetical protein